MGLFNFIKSKSAEEEIFAPALGAIVDIETVEDETFARKLIGDGIAINPTEGVVYAPCDGEIITLLNTLHAIGIKTKGGSELLIHVGIDTVEMKGDGFKAFVSQGDKVKKGQKLLEIDLEKIRDKAKSDTIMLLVAEEEININQILREGVSTLETVVMKVKKK